MGENRHFIAFLLYLEQHFYTVLIEAQVIVGLARCPVGEGDLEVGWPGVQTREGQVIKANPHIIGGCG